MRRLVATGAELLVMAGLQVRYAEAAAFDVSAAGPVDRRVEDIRS
jgi:hypothetical protein